MTTLHDKFVAALTARGYVPVAKPYTRRYTVLGKVGQKNIYIGKAGAVRSGRTASTSHPISDQARATLLAEWDVLPREKKKWP